MNKYTIVNDPKIDAIKDNFTPPSMEEMVESAVIELFSRLEIDIEDFYKHVYDNSEYHTIDEEKFYLVKDVAKVIKSNDN